MSKAVRCDRCKGYFDPYEVVSAKPFLQIEAITSMDGDACRKWSFLGRQENTDLCPGCAEDFRLFMNGAELDLAEITDPLVRKDGV